MTNKANTKDIPVEVSQESSQTPEFWFLGTDGNHYEIGKSPASFIRRVIEKGEMGRQLTIGLLEEWAWEHVRCAQYQQHITLEQFRDLYFYVDLPKIAEAVIKRITDAVISSRDSFENISKVVDMAEKGLKTKEASDGSNERHGREL